MATVSSGNHAQALALAAALHDVAATILMPDDAPAGKLAATRGYGAEVIGFDRYAATASSCWRSSWPSAGSSRSTPTTTRA